MRERQRKTPALAGTGGEGLVGIGLGSHSSLSILHLQYIVENAFGGSPRLTWIHLWQLGQTTPYTEPHLHESLPDWLERLPEIERAMLMEVGA